MKSTGVKRRTVLLAGGAMSLRAAAPERFDVVVYGATPGGIAAAVAAARLGRSVGLCALEDHIGGIVSNGLTNADIGKRQAVGGLFYEFTRRVVGGPYDHHGACITASHMSHATCHMSQAR